MSHYGGPLLPLLLHSHALATSACPTDFYCCAIFLMCMSGNCVAFQLSLRGVETESFCDEAIHWKFRKVMQIATPFQGSQ